MTHTFNLDHPKSPVSSIRLIVSNGHKKYRRQTGLSIDTKLVDMQAKSIKARWKDAEVRTELSEIHRRLTEVEREDMTEAEVMSAIEYGITGKVGQTPGIRPTFWQFFDEWSRRPMKSQRYRRNAYERIKEIMGCAEDWEGVDYSYYMRLLAKLDARDYTLNYRSTIISKLRTAMKEGYDREYHSNEAWRKFKKTFETADTIALSKDELDRLWEMDLSLQEDRKARDLFIIGCYTAARFQNYSRLSTDNIEDGKICFVQPKTGGKVLIPCSPKITEIFGRWGGHAPVLSAVNFNLTIKQVCRKAGFTEAVETRQTRGGRVVVETHQKWELVSTHTARRTGATLLYKSGVPIRICRFLTGHKDDATFLKYIKISMEEAVEILAKNDFFK